MYYLLSFYFPLVPFRNKEASISGQLTYISDPLDFIQFPRKNKSTGLKIFGMVRWKISPTKRDLIVANRSRPSSWHLLRPRDRNQ